MQVDVVVIGAGIQGAGVAQAVAAAGNSVAVLEKTAPASGTSSKSSKLIHGGLRYLESGQFKLVKECLHERHLLLKNAPDLVQLKPFYIPIYQQTTRAPLTIRMGLSLYYGLSGFHKTGQFKSIKLAQWDNVDGLQTQGLRALFQYWDAQTNDSLLTKAVLQSAQSLGAEVIFPAKVIAADYSNECWEVQYLQSNTTEAIQAKVVVNATGPWVNKVLTSIAPDSHQHNVELVQGTHILIPEKTDAGIYYLEAPKDKRAVFVMPWGEQTMIGTTEKIFSDDPDNVEASDEEIEYLIQTVGAYFPRLQSYSKNELSGSFAGLRVLPAGAESAFAKARDTIIFEEKQNIPALFTLYGGKLTAYRATAQQMFERMKTYLPTRPRRANTTELKLSI